ncbi:hypothetical protein V8C42DRAFT_326089 [Trichoderma barbatum]
MHKNSIKSNYIKGGLYPICTMRPAAPAPVHQYSRIGTVCDPETAVSRTDNLDTQDRIPRVTILKREWQCFIRVMVAFLSIATGTLGGVLYHDANLGLEIGAVLTILAVIIEVLERILRETRAQDFDLKDWMLLLR